MQIADPVFNPSYANNLTWLDSGALAGMFPGEGQGRELRLP